MKIHRALALVAMVAVAAAACNDDDDDDLTGVQTCATLTGTFRATTLTAVGTSNTSLNQNLLANGATFTLVFANGNFTSTYVPPAGGTTITRTGPFTVSGTSITLGSQPLFTGGAPGNQVFACAVTGNTLTLANPNTTFNFAGTGTTQSPAAIAITLTRQTT